MNPVGGGCISPLIGMMTTQMTNTPLYQGRPQPSNYTQHNRSLTPRDNNNHFKSTHTPTPITIPGTFPYVQGMRTPRDTHEIPQVPKKISVSPTKPNFPTTTTQRGTQPPSMSQDIQYRTVGAGHTHYESHEPARNSRDAAQQQEPQQIPKRTNLIDVLNEEISKGTKGKVEQPPHRTPERPREKSVTTGGGAGQHVAEDNVVEHVIEEYTDGSRYEGQKHTGLRHGRGVFHYSNGGVYDGEWSGGRMNGYGKMIFSSGRVAYEGELKDDKFEGYGILYNEEPEKSTGQFEYHDFSALGEKWIRYEGEFHNDIKDGKGKLFLTNGERFEGDFIDDKIHGRGKFFTNDSQVVAGLWQDDKLVSIDRIMPLND